VVEDDDLGVERLGTVGGGRSCCHQQRYHGGYP
jgi:hypothetical protein